MTVTETAAAAGAPRENAVQTRLLYEARVELDVPLEVGATPHAVRRVSPIRGGTFEGPAMRGEILPGGADWMLVRPDGIVELDIRATGRTDDGALVYAQERGYLRATPEVLQRMARGEPVEPEAYALRMVSFYETAAPRYAWLNGILGVGVGTFRAGGLALVIHEVL